VGKKKRPRTSTACVLFDPPTDRWEMPYFILLVSGAVLLLVSETALLLVSETVLPLVSDGNRC
jgi:hypothetical protein